MTRAVCAIAATLLWSCTASAQNERPVHWVARAARTRVAAGDAIGLRLHATIAEDFHVYSTTQARGGPVRTTVSLVGSGLWQQVGAVRTSPPETIPDRNFGIMSEVYSDSADLDLVVRALPGAAASRPAIAIEFQACTDHYCLPARTDTIAVALRAEGGALAASAARAPVVAPPPNRVSTVELPARASSGDPIESFGGATSLASLIVLAASMGALALLTPCVFPMIPITVTSFLRHDDRRSAWKGAGLYSLGIVAGFTIGGVLTAAVFGASGLARFAANPAVNVLIALLFLTFALALLGVVQVRAPAFVANRIGRSNGAAAPFAMGIVFTITAFTCTAPFIGTLLVMSALGNWKWPVIGMLVFAAVFAAPFFLLALSPRLLTRAPRAGEWMPVVEAAVAAVEIGAALKFLSNADLVMGWGILTRGIVLSIWIAILALLAAVLLGRRFRGARRVRLGVASAAVVGAALLVPGLFERQLGEMEAFLPPGSAAGLAGSDAADDGWILDDYPAALRSASITGRRVLIDFTGYTCTNCRWMEANMFPRPEVRRDLNRFVRVRLYTDGLGERYATQQRFEQRVFGTVALPLYAVVDPSGAPRARFLGMTRNPAEFREFLQRASAGH